MSLFRTALLRIPRALPATTRSISTLDPLLYTATTMSTGSRASGTSATVEGNISVDTGMPKEMGGTKGPAGGMSNPEQLFGMAFGTCFLSALGAVQGQTAGAKPLPKSTTVRSLVSIGKPKDGTPGFKLGVELEVLTGPLKKAGLDQAGMEELLKKAHAMCPYSRAVAGNIVRTLSPPAPRFPAIATTDPGFARAQEVEIRLVDA
ncbi:hypothetical protein RQP46_001279 [Phenoliferia psychrophenolica]